MSQTTNVLEVKDLTVSVNTETRPIHLIENISFDVQKGKTLGIVGESGCGKSITAMSIMCLLPSPPTHVENGKILLDHQDLLTLSKNEMRHIRGKRISMIFQEPMTSLNPTFSIEFQIGEVLRIHQGMNAEQRQARCLELLDLVGIAAAKSKLEQYPHQLSGGLRQRVMIAMALACKPDLLIADEPTTALDVTIQAQILELLDRLQQELGMSILMITHDLGVVAEFCDDVVVMYAGKVIEETSVEQLFDKPLHPYTRGLLSSIPKLGEFTKYLPTIKGMVPAPADRPNACYFADRCENAIDICRQSIPDLSILDTNHKVSCFNP